MWWLLRKLAESSSSVDSLLRAVAPSISAAHKMRQDFEMVLKLANLMHLLPNDGVDGDVQNDDDADVTDGTTDSPVQIQLSETSKTLFRGLLDALGFTQDSASGSDERSDDEELETPRRSDSPDPMAAEDDEDAVVEDADDEDADDEDEDADDDVLAIPIRGGNADDSSGSDSGSSVDSISDGGLEDVYKNEDEADYQAHSSEEDEDASVSDEEYDTVDEEEEDSAALEPTPAEAKEFLNIFQKNYNGVNSNEAAINAAAEIITQLGPPFANMCLKTLGAKRNTSHACDKMIDWVKASTVGRLLLLMNKNDLLEYAKDKGIKVPSASGLKVETLRAAIRAKMEGTNQEDHLDSEGNEELKLMIALLKQSFLEKQKAGNEEGGSKYTVAGQRAELPLIQQFYEKYHDSCGSLSGELSADSTIEAIYHTGLVKSKYKDYVRDSADAVAIITPDAEEGDCGSINDDSGSIKSIAVPIEVKARVSRNTFHAQRERIISNDSSSGDKWTNLRKGGSNVSYFMNRIAVDEDETGELFVQKAYHEMVPKSSELLQCLHHSYTYRSNSGILLIGDKRDLFAVIHTYYPTELLTAYGRICTYLFDRVLAPFYAKSSDDKLPELPREVYDALKSDQLKHLKISEDAFNCFFGLWYRVNVVPENYLALNLPYPKTARIIPISVSKWNTLKGGGDAITKLIDSC
eukprot:scaffold11588_cov77-Skeletonema_dohrnii-CCMP3373.AAC.2